MQQTVLQLIQQAVATYPDRIAGEDQDGRRLTVRELDRRSNRVANALRGIGVGKGDAVAYIGRNHLEYLEIDWGITKAGAVRVPLYHQLGERDVARAMELTGARVLIADLEAATQRVPGVLGVAAHPIVLGGTAAGWVGYDDWMSGGSDRHDPVALSGADRYLVRMTSGSSGQPKGVLLSHLAGRTAILGNTYILNREGRCPAPRTLQQAPVTLASGWSLLPTLLSGGTNVFIERFDPERVATQIADLGIAWTMVVPTMLRMLATHGNLDDLHRSGLRCLIYGGEPPPVESMHRLLDATDALVQVFGQTEAPSWTTLLTREEHQDESLWRSCGRAIPGIDIGVVVGDEVQRVATDEGEFAIRGPNVATTLLGAEAEHARRLRPDGWWLTGDNAVIDDAGRLHLVGRRSEMIIRGGSNIHPAEIETTLGSHPDVTEVAVVGVADDVWGEVPVALVCSDRLVGEEGVAQLDRWADAHLTKYKRPARVLLQVEPLPRLGDDDSKISKPGVKRRVEELLVRTEGPQ